MRIRKRKVPLPLSLLSPIPISDPHLFSRSPVILVQPVEDETTHHGNNSQPSDHLTSSDLSRLIDDGNSSSDHHRHDDCMMIKSDPLLKEQVPHDMVGCLGFGGVESMPKSNDASNKSITALGTTAAEVCSNGPSPSPNHEDQTRWCDEDKAMPLKKRRGSIEQTKSKPSENCVEKFGIDGEEMKISIKDNTTITTTNNNNTKNNNINHNNNNNNNSVSAKKGSKRGNTIMEGSRCSRVNGRGWRCCQPTLVGYSLCEHHLGKGRLRSMSSVRGRPSTTSKKAALGKSSTDDCSPLMQLCEAVKKESETLGNNIDKKRGITIKSFVGKRLKLGVVKARSLSSLLGQTNTTSSSDAGLRIAVAPLREPCE